ncbi:MAG: MazG family protein [Bacillota bacterium]|nr:MazG family protein [Bacillota bacterium]
MDQDLDIFLNRSRYEAFEDLEQLVRLLRAPNGCPWDREQTAATLRTHVIEEAYELVDAIDRNDSKALCEELGDLLLQVIFQTELASEAGLFDRTDVIDGIMKKLISRHSHVFGQDRVSETEEVLDLWERNKQKEKGQKSAADRLRGVALALPALLRAQKLERRAPAAEDPWLAIGRGLASVNKLQSDSATPPSSTSPSTTSPSPELEAAYGELLFALAALGNRHGLNAEAALAAANRAYVEKFSEADL